MDFLSSRDYNALITMYHIHFLISCMSAVLWSNMCTLHSASISIYYCYNIIVFRFSLGFYGLLIRVSLGNEIYAAIQGLP